MSRIAPGKRISLEEAVCKITECTEPIMESEAVTLWNAPGRILAQDIMAAMDQPPFSRAVMDGYALCAGDTRGALTEMPVKLQVIGEVTAGDMPEMSVCRGQAVRIMTGAPIPEGADCIVRQEDTDYGERSVCIYRAYTPGEFCGRQGEDYSAGECMVKSGRKLYPPEIGLAASAGMTELKVRRFPRLALFTTGDELTEPGEVLLSGKIYNGNKYMLYAWLKERGITPCITESLPDDADLAAARMDKAAQKVDCIITTGGISVGKKDVLHDVLRKLDASVVFQGVAVKPGGPVTFSVNHKVPILCLSGNPAGAMVHLELLGRPLIAALAGDKDMLPVRAEAVMEEDYGKTSKIRRMVYGICRDKRVRPVSVHGLSGTISSMRGYNCLMDLEAGNPGLRAGDKVKVFLL